MTVTAHSLTSPPSRHLRLLRLQRDLGAVADLVELCFADTLDTDGRRYINQMRNAARSPHAVNVSSRIAPSFSGFVWEENGEIIGNLNLLPVVAEGRQAYLIANVAVHPDHRRRGIAHALTEAGLNYIRQKGIKIVWLQANAENPAAIHLYQGFDFVERARRTTWHSPGQPVRIPLPERVLARPRRGKDWKEQRAWLERSYPGSVRWHLALRPGHLNPGLSGLFRRLLTDRSFRHWSAYNKGKLIGTASWQSSYAQADWLWLATAPDHEDLAICALLPHVQGALASSGPDGRSRPLAVNYPHGLGAEAFNAAGYQPRQTLIWMQTFLG